MSVEQGQSCPLCGQVDERPSMVLVRLPYPRLASHDTALICRPCASAVAARALELEGESPSNLGKRSANDERKHKPAGKPGKPTHSETTAPDTRDPEPA